MSECKTPGCCECPNMTRCEACGYTQHDKDYWMDHRVCDKQETSRKDAIDLLERALRGLSSGE